MPVMRQDLQAQTSFNSLQIEEQESRNTSIAYLRSESLQKLDGAAVEAVANLDQHANLRAAVQHVRRQANQSEMQLDQQNTKGQADGVPADETTSQNIMNMIERAQTEQLQKFDQLRSRSDDQVLPTFKKTINTATAAIDRYDQRESISTISMINRENQLPTKTTLALMNKGKNATNTRFPRYDTVREPSQLETQQTKEVENRDCSSKKLQPSSLYNPIQSNPCIDNASRTRLYPNRSKESCESDRMDTLENTKNMGSVSTIRDETSLNNRNTSRMMEHKLGPESSPKAGVDAASSVNQNVRVVIRKIQRSKEPSSRTQRNKMGEANTMNRVPLPFVTSDPMLNQSSAVQTQDNSPQARSLGRTLIGPSQRVLQIPRNKIRMVNEAAGQNSGTFLSAHKAMRAASMEHGNNSNTNQEEDLEAKNTSVISSLGLFDDNRSPELPDRKRYAQKEKVSLGLYQPSFPTHTNSSKDTINFGRSVNQSNAIQASEMDVSMVMADQAFSPVQKKPSLGFGQAVMENDINNALESDGNNHIIASGQVTDSQQAVRKISLASGDISFKTRHVMKSRVRGDIRTMIARNNPSMGRSRQSDIRGEAMESASSVVMAAGMNQSQQDSFSIDQNYQNAVAEKLSQEIETSSIGQALKKVIPRGGYRSKLSFRTPLQRGSNNSNFIKYQNSLASESVERKRIQTLGLGSQQQSTVTDRSFSIQPQYRMMHKRLDELSRGSSQERIGDPYQTIPVNSSNAQNTTQQHRLSRQQQHRQGSNQKSIRQAESRESSHQLQGVGTVASTQSNMRETFQGPGDVNFRSATIDHSHTHQRVMRSPFDSQHRITRRNIAQQQYGQQQNNQEGEIASTPYINDRQSPVKVPGILMDSINSQQLRSKSTFRGNNISGYGGNKLTSLQTMAQTSDQQFSLKTGAMMGLASMQSYAGAAGANPKSNLDRCALLEEIEKSKVEEIKQKTLKNLDKYSKQASAFNATNMAKFTNVVNNNKYAVAASGMNTTVGSQNSATANPFARTASKQGTRSKAISRGNASSNIESQISKKSFEKGIVNETLAMEKLNEQLRERDISPAKFSTSRAMDSILEKSPILVQQYSGSGGQSRFMAEGQSRGSKLTTRMGAQDASTLGREPGITGQIQLGSSIEGAQLKRKFNRNTINLAKLSLVLKTKNKLNISQQDSAQTSGGVSQMSDQLTKFQRKEITSIATILNETLSKLKKPNTHVLQPLDQSALQKTIQTNKIGEATPMQPSKSPLRHTRLSLMNLVGSIRQSIQGNNSNVGVGVATHAISDVDATSSMQQRSRSQSPVVMEPCQEFQAENDDTIIPEEEVELDLDDLTQEDKFYLIQQIEAVQKNIRYYSSNQETYVFQDFEEGAGANNGSESQNPTSAGQNLDSQSQPPASRYTNNSDELSNAQASEETFTQTNMQANKRQQSPGEVQNDPRESPKMAKREDQLSKRVSFGASKLKINSPSGAEILSRNSYNVNNAISFVTSALGLLAHESLEIIEDADEVEEDELDHINLCEQQSPKIKSMQQPECASPVPMQHYDEPPSPSHSGPFKHQHRKLRRNLNEGQKQILCKSDLKRYKGGNAEENQQSDDSNKDKSDEDGPEEVSVLLRRGSRVAKDFDMLRFSKASSVEQNFLVDGEIEPQGQQHSASREQLMDRQERSPMSVRRVAKPVSKKQTTVSLRKLTNSLFMENGTFKGIIEEEEKEREEQD